MNAHNEQHFTAADMADQAAAAFERGRESVLAEQAAAAQEAVAWMTHHDEPMLYPTFAEAAAYCDDGEPPIPLYAASVSAAPEGFVLVPVEPTEEMLMASKLFQCDHSENEDWMEWEGLAAANQYRAMLAARPQGVKDV